MLRLLLFVIALILYGSLYPWDFHFHRLGQSPLNLLLRGWPAFNRYLLRDFAINVLLYAPLGLAACLAGSRHLGRRLSAVAALLLGIVLSTGIEILQIFDSSRTASAFDIACNAVGTAAGVAFALAAAGPVQRAFAHHRARWQAAPDAALVLALFIARQLYPVFPSLSTHALAAKVQTFMHTRAALDSIANATLEWLAAALALELLTRPGSARRHFGLLMLLLPARFLIAAPPPGLADFFGAMTAAVVWTALPRRMPARHLAAAGLTLLCLAQRGLSPFDFSAHAATFSWIPFAATLDSAWLVAGAILIRKALAYGAAVWLLRAPLRSYTAAAAVVAVVLAGIEFVQLWLPGHTPESTDPVLALLMAALLHGMERDGTGAGRV